MVSFNLFLHSICKNRALCIVCRRKQSNVTKCPSIFICEDTSYFVEMKIITSGFYGFLGTKRSFFQFFNQKKDENVFFTEKSCTFASQLSNGLWCNGNTADSGPAFPGSSPGSPTKKRILHRVLFFYLCCFQYKFRSDCRLSSS